MESEGRLRWSRGIRPGAPGSRATRIDLYYDLVFVFAFLNVTTLTARELTVASVVRALLVLTLLWWCWVGFAALGNVVRTDQGVLPLVGFGTVAAVFVLALTIPGAFTDRAGGLHGPTVFAVCYFLVRASQVAIAGWVHRADPASSSRWLPLAAPVLVATALILTAAMLPRGLLDRPWGITVGLGLFLAALLVEYGAPLLNRGAAPTVISAGHWAERHALILLVALGESLISLGLASKPVTGLPLTWPVIIGAVLGVAVASALWWSYFDTLALAVEQVLHRTRDPVARTAFARDVYTYLHLPMIAGIIFFALGLKGLLYDAADPGTPPWGAPRPGVDLFLLYGGVALYLLALAGLGVRALRVLRWPPVVAAGLLALLAWPTHLLPGILVLAVLTLVCVVLAVTQTVLDAPRRRRVREVALSEQLAAEAEQSEWRRRHL